MKKTKYINQEAATIKRETSSYKITIPINRKLISSSEEYYFVLKQRNGFKKIPLHSSIQCSNQKFYLFEVNISPPTTELLQIEKEIWDLYFYMKKNNEEKNIRIKTTNKSLHTFTILIDSDKMFYPYKTRHSNLSFVISYHNVFASFTNVSISNHKINLNGYFYYPPLDNDDHVLVHTEIIVTNASNHDVLRLPLQCTERESSNMPMISFNCALPLTYIKQVHRIAEYKFYFELVVKTTEGIQTLSSQRMCWIQEARLYKLKKKMQHPMLGKVTLFAHPTKKAKYLTLQLSNFNSKARLAHRTKEKLIKLRRSKFVKQLYTLGFFLMGLLPKKKIIIFESFHGKQISCNPRAIYEYMKEKNLNYKMYWSVDRKHAAKFANLDVKTVHRFTIKWLLLMPTAKYWIVNSRLPLWLPKPKRTIYVQTWHGTPLKKLAADMDEVHMPATNAETYVNNFLKEAQKWDYLISPNRYSTEIFKRAFGFKKHIIESGYPRNDFLLKYNNKGTITKLKQKMKLPHDKKVILYAPTWRDHEFYAKGKYKFDLQLNFNELKKALSNEYIVLLRLHYLIAENLDLSAYEGFIFDYSHYEDIRDLYLVSDLLITDYSSVFFDYANLKRPMIFFVYDIEHYRDKLRGFYFDFEKSAPGPLVKTTKEVIFEIRTRKEKRVSQPEHANKFYEKFCLLEDGASCKRVVDKIFFT